MLKRINQIIEEKGLLASSFADKIQVSRGTITHILSGRNNPSKDTIEKILNTFPDISLSWLIKGEGPVYNHERTIIKPLQADLFSEITAIESSGKPQAPEYGQKIEVKKPENDTDSIIIKDVNLSKIPPKKIEKIMIFFNDKTFMTFIPEE